jgi:3-oxoacyl-[acyl-carrier-protein] synthase II
VSRPAVVVTAVALRTAGPPDVASARPEPEAAALDVPRVARVPDLVEDDAFPDDRKGSLAAAVLGDLLPALPAARRGLFLGTGLSSLTPDELRRDLYPALRGDRFDRVWLAQDLAPGRPAPRRHQPERVTAVLSERIGAVRAETNFSACAAAAQSIAAAARAVARGDVDVALAGGHDSMLHPLGYLSFVVLGALSPTVGRPFDRRRDGFLIGEGAALLQLEREADARARGAPVLARFLGAGSSVDAYNVTAPHPEGYGAALAMRRALRDADLAPRDVDYVNAHGTGTPVGDIAESLAIHAVLGEVPTSSFKGAFGHCIAAAGAVEMAWCIRGFGLGRTWGTVGCETPDPELRCEVLTIDRERAPRVVLSNSFGFGGQNCALLVGAP